MAGAVRYYAWYTDRGEQGRVPVDMHLAFIRKQFHGLGKDKIGHFAVINGKIKGSDISFKKRYSSHSVLFKGKLMSNPLMAQGTWSLPSRSQINGNWAMSLQGNPNQGAITHSVRQWAPKPCIARGWDSTAISRLFGSTGPREMAKDLRRALRLFFREDDLQSALKLQILTDYGGWIQHQGGMLETDGQSFGNPQEARATLRWFEQLKMGFRNAIRRGEEISFLEEIDKQVISLLKDVE